MADHGLGRKLRDGGAHRQRVPRFPLAQTVVDRWDVGAATYRVELAGAAEAAQVVVGVSGGQQVRAQPEPGQVEVHTGHRGPPGTPHGADLGEPVDSCTAHVDNRVCGTRAP